MSKLILGIDPGTRITGFGLVRASGSEIQHVTHGIVQMTPTAAFPERIFELGEALGQILAKYRPDIVVIEKIFMGKNADSAFKLGHARGVAMLEARRVQAEVVEYATRLVKKGIAGTGAASKEDVQVILQRLLNVRSISKIDASDALALAAFHGFQLQSQRRQRQAVNRIDAALEDI
jgi:crossover junction endodeoxyribonuclease RuvC